MGVLICLLPPTTFDFSQLKSIALSNILFPFARRIDLSRFETASIALRVHSATFAGGPDNLEIDIFPDAFTTDDTASGFDTAGPSLLVAPLVITTSPDYQVAPLNAPFGGLVRVVIEGTRGTPPGTTMIARISVDMYGKTGGEARATMARKAGTFRGYGPPPLIEPRSMGDVDSPGPPPPPPLDWDDMRRAQPFVPQVSRRYFGPTREALEAERTRRSSSLSSESEAELESERRGLFDG